MLALITYNSGPLNPRRISLMKNLMNTVAVKPDTRLPFAGRAAAVLLAGLLLSACGQESTSGSAGEPGASVPESDPIISDAALNAAHQAVQSVEERALLESAQIAETIPKPTAQQQQEAARALEEASRKTDEMLKQAAAEAAASSENQ
jgi:hypothetical protein